MCEFHQILKSGEAQICNAMRIFNKIKGNNIEKIAWKGASDVLFWRYPNLEANVVEAQLMVKENQLAVVISKKQETELYGKGQYTIAPESKAIFFVSTKPFLNVHWQTHTSQACIEDSEFGKVCIEMQGIYSFRITDKISDFITGVFQQNTSISCQDLEEKLNQLLVTNFVSYLTQSKVALLDLTTSLEEFSAEFTLAVGEYMEQKGVKVIDFQLKSMLFPEQISKKIKQMSTQKQPQGATLPPPLPQEGMYYIAICGMQRGPFTIIELEELKKQGILNRGTLVWTVGMPHWDIAEKQNQLIPIFHATLGA